ncbi:MAG: nucleotidyltransferase family protein [Alphaproteobacteria bacterium]
MSESNMHPDKAFILAAGFGTRMRPYTDHCPKPMVQVAGRSLIWRTLDKLFDAGVRETVVNVHYMAEILRAHLQDYCSENPKMVIHISLEDEILDTGGGVKNALHYFGDDPFYVIAGDALWDDAHDVNALKMLAQAWDAEKMDIVTLMQPLEGMQLSAGVGDYDLHEDGRVHRSRDKTGQYMWTNIRLNSPKIYRDVEEHSFSFLKIMDACEKAGRFYALPYMGQWHHISCPKDLETVDADYKTRVKV